MKITYRSQIVIAFFELTKGLMKVVEWYIFIGVFETAIDQNKTHCNEILVSWTIMQ